MSIFVIDMQAAVESLLDINPAASIASPYWAGANLDDSAEEADCIVARYVALVFEAE